jgi:hypothetical protein
MWIPLKGSKTPEVKNSSIFMCDKNSVKASLVTLADDLIALEQDIKPSIEGLLVKKCLKYSKLKYLRLSLRMSHLVHLYWKLVSFS